MTNSITNLLAELVIYFLHPLVSLFPEISIHNRILLSSDSKYKTTPSMELDLNDEEWQAFLDEMRDGVLQNNVPLDFTCNFQQMSREFEELADVKELSAGHAEHSNSNIGKYYTLSPPAYTTTFNLGPETTEAVPQLKPVIGVDHEGRAENDLVSQVVALERQ